MSAARAVRPPPAPVPAPKPTTVAGRGEPHPATQLLTITTHPAPPAATVLTLRGDVDMLTSTQLNDHLLRHVWGTVSHVIVNLTDVDFFGVAGLTVLVNASEAAAETDTTLCLVASTRPVLLPLKITGLHRVFDISPDLAHALLRAGCGPDA